MIRVLSTWALALVLAGCAGPGARPSSAGIAGGPSSTAVPGATAAVSALPAIGPRGTSAAAWLDEGDEDEQAEDGPGVVGVGWGILMYLPNRFLDVFDVARARVRLGPGLAFGARATEYADVYLGFYASVYVGLPGPRGRKLPRLPVGLESKSGAEVSVADVTAEGGLGPDYGEGEIGVGFQLLLVGVDVGVDPFEILDLVVGFLTFDPMDDDF